MTDRRTRLLAVVGALAVLALLAVVVAVRRHDAGSVASPSDQSGSPISTDPSTTSTSAPSTPSTPTPANGSSAATYVEPSVEAAVASGATASVIVTLDVTPTGTDAEKTATVRDAVDRMVAALPAGTWSDVGEAGTVPVVTLTLDQAGLERLRHSGAVTVVAGNHLNTPTAESGSTPSDTNTVESIDSTATMGAVASWAAGWRGAGSTVAVLDTGVQTDHPYLMNGLVPKTIAEACFVNPDPGWTSPCPGGVSMSPTDAPVPGSAQPCSASIASCKHGTHVAGIAVGGDGVSVPSGVAPAASLISVQVYESNGGSLGASDSDINNALQWLYTNRARFPDLVAVNMSLGGGAPSAAYCDWSPTKFYIDQLLAIGVSTAVAAGNNGSPNGVTSPGCISTAVTVGSVTGVPDQSASYSNVGPQVDLMAPGSSITSSVPGGGMALLSGTSMATPAVAGSFAVLHQSAPAEMLSRLRTSGYLVSTTFFVVPSVRLNTATAAYPGPPGSITVVPAAGEATVSWTAPVVAGLTPITSYVVDASPGPGTCSTSGLGCTITGLASCSVQTFTVRATSVSGRGPLVSSPATSILSPTSGPGLNPVEPARLVDTRAPTGSNGVLTIDGQALGDGPIGPGSTRSVSVVGRGCVPPTGVGAVALNVTAVTPSAAGFLTVYPNGTSLPNSSNLNFVPGQTVANMVITKVGSDGKVAIFNSAGGTDVVVDVVGWFPVGPDFTSIAPERFLDTRAAGSGITTVDNTQIGVGRIGGGQTYSLPVTGRGSIPSVGVGAVALNVTAVDPTVAGFVTVFPGGTTRPNASNLNFTPGAVLPNMVIAGVGADGTVAIYNNAGSVNVVVDVLGWFPTGSNFTPTDPTRYLDTRPPGPGISTFDGSDLGGGRVGAGETRTLKVTNRGPIPASGVHAVVLNVTAVVPSVGTYLTVYPDGSPRPTASNLNVDPGRTVPNLVIAMVGPDGKVAIYNNAGSVDVVVDVVGWFP